MRTPSSATLVFRARVETTISASGHAHPRGDRREGPLGDDGAGSGVDLEEAGVVPVERAFGACEEPCAVGGQLDDRVKRDARHRRYPRLDLVGVEIHRGETSAIDPATAIEATTDDDAFGRGGGGENPTDHVGLEWNGGRRADVEGEQRPGKRRDDRRTDAKQRDLGPTCRSWRCWEPAARAAASGLDRHKRRASRRSAESATNVQPAPIEQQRGNVRGIPTVGRGMYWNVTPGSHAVS